MVQLACVACCLLSVGMWEVINEAPGKTFHIAKRWFDKKKMSWVLPNINITYYLFYLFNSMICDSCYNLDGLEQIDRSVHEVMKFESYRRPFKFIPRSTLYLHAPSSMRFNSLICLFSSAFILNFQLECISDHVERRSLAHCSIATYLFIPILSIHKY